MIPGPDDNAPSHLQWTPLDAPSASFRMMQLKEQSDGSLRLAPTRAMRLCALAVGGAGIFAAATGVGLLLGVVDAVPPAWPGALIALTVGVAFTLGSWLMLRHVWNTPAFACDQRMCLGLIENPSKLKRRRVDVPFAKVVGLQILARLQNESDSPDWTSYQLNLVLKDHSRLNLMDHSHLEALEEDAEILAQVLQVPVWKRL